jgi:hypothetical protein
MSEVERTGRMVAAAAVQLASPSDESVGRAIELLSASARRAAALTSAMREGAIPLAELEKQRGEEAWRRVRMEARRVGRLVAQLNEHATERLRQLETGPRVSVRG